MVPPMRSRLEPLYRLTALMAVLSLIAIAVIILADVTLRQFGSQLKSSADFAGFALVATVMLGLAPCYRRGEHIRVGLLIDRLSGNARRAVEIFCLTFGVIAIGWASWWTGRFVYDSWRFNDVSQGLLTIPLWIPQFFMFFGFLVFFIALTEDLILVLQNKTPSYMAHASADTDLPTFER